MECPNCKKQTLFRKGFKLVCSNPNCRYTITVPVNDGKGGKGNKCPVCGRFTWFNGRCSSCGAHD